jgi:hypothetical protein
MENPKTIQQFIPKRFKYLSEHTKINFKGQSLKTAYIINLIHELILKFYFTGEIKFDLWSILLRKKYGKYYNLYIEYLIRQKFMYMSSNYYVGSKSRTYKLIKVEDWEIIRCKVKDKILLKKHSKDFLNKTFLDMNQSPISPEVRAKIVEDLYQVQINYTGSKNYLNQLQSQGDLKGAKYYRNLSSIDGIQEGHIFFRFDNYGRVHTNFTILKKEIRQQYLTIEDCLLTEFDLKNSQPLFFALLLKQEIGSQNFNQECWRFYELVKNGLIYDDLISKHQLPREKIKLLFYKVLFGNNNEENEENQIFKIYYPTVYNYLLEIKSINNSYREMSHQLQKMESDFIFGRVVKDLILKYPYVKLFTVHDSIVVPQKYEEEVALIFNYHYQNLF